MGGIFNNITLESMGKALDGAALRQKVIANNLANADTPNYKAMEVTFEDELKKAIDSSVKKSPGSEIKLSLTNSKHISINTSNQVNMVEPNINVLEDLSLRNDKNNVDVDRETSKLTKNEIFYDTVTRLINDEFQMLKLVISEGKR
ncbi:MAG: flagellar basal body rod protein FlgB [Chitinophagales bacterium]